MRMLDTDVMIDVQRGHANAVEWFRGLAELPMLPGYVFMELIQDASNNKQLAAVRKLVKPLPIVWCSPSECSQALGWFIKFHLSDNLGLLDSLIGACAVGRDADLCTFNTKHYRVIPGLRLIQPYAR